MKRIVILSDKQIPYHDKRATKNVVQFVRDYSPDELANVGDEIDCPQPARWNKGFAVEYSGTLGQHIESNYRLQAELREAIGGYRTYRIMRSNHVDRLETYLTKYAPAFAGLRIFGDEPLSIEKLLRYDKLDITYHRQMFDIAPGWVLAHGDEGNLSPLAGRTATNLAVNKVGKSVICGHTHRAGISSKSFGYNGKIHTTLYGVEVGNLMDIRKAHYLKSGSGDWQQAFAILYVDGNRVTPQLVYIQRDGSFIVDGHRWG